MARLTQCGFEEQTTTAGVEVHNLNGSPTISNTVNYLNGSSLKVSGLVSGAKQSITLAYNNTTTLGPIFARLRVRFDTLPSAENTFAALTSDLNGIRCYLTIDNTGTLRFRDASGNLVGTYGSTISTTTWYRMDMQVSATALNTATTTIEARVNGTVFATTSTATISTGVGKIEVGGNIKSEAQTTGVWYFDDLAVNDSTGTHETSYPGDGHIIHQRPNAAGDANSFATQNGGTAGSSNNYTRVNEIPPDDATSYNGSNTLNQEDLFNMDASGLGSSDTINTVVANVRFANDVADATTAFKLELIKTSGGTKSQSAALVPNSTGWRTNTTANGSDKNDNNPPLVTYTDPDGAAWTQTTLDSMQAGYILSTGSTNKVLISTLWVSVDYTAVVAPTTAVKMQAIRGWSFPV